MIIPETIIKMLIKRFKLKKILNYVENDNELDEKCKQLEKRMDLLEKMAHPVRDFVRCKQCEERITESSKLMQATRDETI